MSDQFEDDEIEEQDEEVTPSSDSEVLTLLKRMQQQLAFLEKKIDTLLQASGSQGSHGSDRPRFNDRRFSRPPRPYGGQPSYGNDRGGPRGGGDRGPRNDFAPRGRSFDRGPRSGGGFDKPRRDDNRGGNFSQGKKRFFRGDK